jgi:hypothetical protein
VRAGAVLLALALGACTTGSTDDPSSKPRRDLAARPQSLAPLPSGAASPSAVPSGAVSGSRGPGSPGASSPAAGTPVTTSGPPSGRPTGAPASNGPAAPFHGVGSTSDRTGDAGATTPRYADLASVTVEDDGTNARVTVRMNGPVPATVPAAETMGVGVDLYRTRLQNESDYQLFADGQPDGWYAYLHTPKGFVKYPGTFGIGGDRIVFTVPWSALGSPSNGAFGAFSDWTRAATPSNLSGEDVAPELAHAPYQR